MDAISFCRNFCPWFDENWTMVSEVRTTLHGTTDNRNTILYRAVCSSDGKEVAIKRIHRRAYNRYISILGCPRLLYKEGVLMGLLKRIPVSPYIIEMWFDEPKLIYLIIEYPQPFVVRQEYVCSNGLISEEVARGLMCQLVLAIQNSLDHSIVHNDLHANNILVNAKTMDLKLIDFDCAYQADRERIETIINIIFRVLGPLLCFMVTRDPPDEEAESCISLNPSFSPELWDLIKKYLKPNSEWKTIVQILLNQGFRQEPITEAATVAEQEPVLKPEPVLKLEPDTELDGEPKSVPDSEPVTEPELDVEPKPVPDPEPDTEPEFDAEPKPVTELELDVEPTSVPDPKPVIEPELDIKPKPVPDPEPVIEPELDVKPKSVPDPQPDPEHEPVPGPTVLQNTSETEPSSVPRASIQELNNGCFTDLYRWENMLGCGSFCKVFKAVRKSDGKEVAIKMISKRSDDYYISIPVCSRPLLKEVATMILMKRPPVSPYVIELFEWFDEPDSVSLVMEYPKPCVVLLDFVISKNHLSEEVTRCLIRQLILAVQNCLDHGIVHNNLHDDNILVNTRTLELKLIDFSFAYRFKRIECERVVQDIAETVGYMSFFMMKGWPLRFSNARELQHKLNSIPGLSSECCELIKRCLRRNTEWETLEEILQHQWLKLQ